MAIHSAQAIVPHTEQDRRRGARAIALPRLVRLESAVFVEDARLIDVGRLGFSVRTMVSYAPGSIIQLCVEEYPPIKARAVWHSHGRLGARFDEPLDLEMLATLTGAN